MTSDAKADPEVRGEPRHAELVPPREPGEHEVREPSRPSCPRCGGPMWDNRAGKRNPRAPDFKCRDRDCDGRLWPGQVKAGQSTEPVGPMPTAPTAGTTASRGPLADTVDAVMAELVGRDERTRVRAELRACYLDVTDFVLAEVRPRYDAAGVPCTDATAAAIAATLFIATCDRRAIGAPVAGGALTGGTMRGRD